MKFKVIHRWQDLDLELEAGDIITLDTEEVIKVQDRMKKYGDLADLVPYGLYVVPLNYLNRVK